MSYFSSNLSVTFALFQLCSSYAIINTMVSVDDYQSICNAIENDPKNVSLVSALEEYFQKAELYEELVKLYKIAFIYNLDPIYFEKIAELYIKMDDYQEAINYYLKFCETKSPEPKTLYRLANIFEKTGDLKSKEMCLGMVEKCDE